MTYNELWRKLAQIYGEGEAKAMARLVFEVRFGLTLSDICIGKDTQLSADSQAELAEILRRLLCHEPVQYVLGVADFCGRQFLAIQTGRFQNSRLSHFSLHGRLRFFVPFRDGLDQ